MLIKALGNIGNGFKWIAIVFVAFLLGKREGKNEKEKKIAEEKAKAISDAIKLSNYIDANSDDLRDKYE